MTDTPFFRSATALRWSGYAMIVLVGLIALGWGYHKGRENLIGQEPTPEDLSLLTDIAQLQRSSKYPSKEKIDAAASLARETETIAVGACHITPPIIRVSDLSRTITFTNTGFRPISLIFPKKEFQILPGKEESLKMSDIVTGWGSLSLEQSLRFEKNLFAFNCIHQNDGVFVIRKK